MKKKRAVTLIEVLVSLGLFSILASSLFFFYNLFYKHKYTLQKEKEIVYERRYALIRLENILSRAKLPFFKSQKGDGLIFLFDRGVYVNPLLSGTVLGHLFLDKENQCLCLSIWPFPNKEDLLKEPHETFALLENVHQVDFEFYFPPKAHTMAVDPEKVGTLEPKAGWQDQWPYQFNQLPAFVKVMINETEIQSLIDLNRPIYYAQEKIET